VHRLVHNRGLVVTRLRDRKNWLLIKRNDENASTELDIVEQRPESVKRAPKKSRRAAKAKLPAFVTPQLATLVTAPPKSGNWVYEVKHDGYRMLARISPGVRLFTRSGNDWTAKLPHLAKAIEKLGLKDTWLDGEIVVPGADGRASFQALQNAFDAGSDAKIVYYVFDAPFLDGTREPLLPSGRRGQLMAALGRVVDLCPPVYRLEPLPLDAPIAGLRVLPTPGHTPGHVCFWHDEDRALLSGDALVVESGEPALPASSLSHDPVAARASLAALRALPIRHLLPGHGAPILDDAAARIAALLDRAGV